MTGFGGLTALITGGASGIGLAAADVAAAIAYLANPDASAVTGTAQAVDGAMAGLRVRSEIARRVKSQRAIILIA